MSDQPTVTYLKLLKRLGFSHAARRDAVRTTAPTPAPPTPPPPAKTDPPLPPVEAAAPPLAKTAPPPPAEEPQIAIAPDGLSVPEELTPEERVARLDARREELSTCERCKLCPAQNSDANRLVYGVGNPQADLVFVGEGPGEQEDAQGEPFVGKGGELLTKMIGAMGLNRSDIYICNVVKHRPPGNRDPKADEIEACEPYLIEQLKLINPKVLVTLGNCATKTLLRTKKGIMTIRGTWHEYNGIPTMPTYHPAFVLRQYSKKNRGDVWSDLQQVLEKMKG